jgi:hypothetical protein
MPARRPPAAIDWYAVHSGATGPGPGRTSVLAWRSDERRRPFHPSGQTPANCIGARDTAASAGSAGTAGRSARPPGGFRAAAVGRCQRTGNGADHRRSPIPARRACKDAGAVRPRRRTAPQTGRGGSSADAAR